MKINLKKAFAGVLIASMFLTGCGSSANYSDGLTAYTASIDDVKQEQNYTVKNTIDATITENGEGNSSHTVANVKRIYNSDTDYKLQFEITASVDDEDNTASGYMENGMLYIGNAEQNFKYEEDYNNVISMLGFDDFSYTDDVIAEKTYEKNSNGGYDISFNFDNAKFMQALATDLSDVADALYIGDDDFEPETITAKAVTDKDNKIISNEFYIKGNYKYSDTESAGLEYKILNEYSDFGSTTIEAPADLDSYIDINAQADDSSMDIQQDTENSEAQETTESQN